MISGAPVRIASSAGPRGVLATQVREPRVDATIALAAHDHGNRHALRERRARELDVPKVGSEQYGAAAVRDRALDVAEPVNVTDEFTERGPHHLGHARVFHRDTSEHAITAREDAFTLRRSPLRKRHGQIAARDVPPDPQAAGGGAEGRADAERPAPGQSPDARSERRDQAGLEDVGAAHPEAPCVFT
jgi:hypothetical protein